MIWTTNLLKRYTFTLYINTPKAIPCLVWRFSPENRIALKSFFFSSTLIFKFYEIPLLSKYLIHWKFINNYCICYYQYYNIVSTNIILCIILHYINYIYLLHRNNIDSLVDVIRVSFVHKIRSSALKCSSYSMKMSLWPV